MRLIPSFCALACASALPLAAPAQTVAETPAPETAPETAGRTVLDVTASGTLTGLAADALGPDAALTVRLHGPVAFDVDTADFASLEIFADDPAVKLTVSDTAAYDRITAVSLPKAYDRITAVSIPKAYGASAAATFTAAAAGVVALAEGDATTGTAPQNRVISINFVDDRNSDSELKANGGNAGVIAVPSTGWNAVKTGTKNGTMLNHYNLDTNEASPSDATISKSGPETWYLGSTWTSESGKVFYSNNDARLFGAYQDTYRGSIQDDDTTVTVQGLTSEEQYAVYIYPGTEGNEGTSGMMSAFKIETQTADGAEWIQRGIYKGDGADTVPAEQLKERWGSYADFRQYVENQPIVWKEGKNYLRIEGLSGLYGLRITMPSWDGERRAGLAAFQIANSFTEQVTGTTVATLSDFGLCGTVTLADGATLRVDCQPAHLSVIGPETGTATLQIAMNNLDWSKIDLSEADNVTIELVSGCTTIPGGEWAVGDVKISTPVTLTVDGADVSPYWSVGGTLTIADSVTLTIAVAEGVTVPNPYKVIQASSVPDAGIQSAEGYKVSKVDNVYWLLGQGGLRAEVPQDSDGTVLWSELTWKDSVTGNPISEPIFAAESAVTLVFSATSARTVQFDGAKATAEGAKGNVTIDALTVRTPTGVNPVISYGSDANNNRFWVNGRVTLVGEGATLGQSDTYPTLTMPIRAHAAIDSTQTRGVLQLDKANLVLGTDAGLEKVPDGQTDPQFNGTWYRKNIISGNGTVRYKGTGTLQLDATVSPSRFEQGVVLEVTQGTLAFPNNGSGTCHNYVDMDLSIGNGTAKATLAVDQWSQQLHFGENTTVTLKGGSLMKLANGNNNGGPIEGGRIIIDATTDAPVVFQGSNYGSATDIRSPISGVGTLKLEQAGNSWKITSLISDGESGQLALEIDAGNVDFGTGTVQNTFSGGLTIPSGTTTVALRPSALGRGTITVEEGGTLVLSEALAETKVFAGSGTVKLSNGGFPVSEAANTSFAGDEWRGTVYLADRSNFADTNNRLAACGRAGSTIEFGGTNAGYFAQARTCEADICISGTLKINNGWSSNGGYTFNGALTGSGTLTLVNAGSNITDIIRFAGGAPNFAGDINVSGGRCVVFGEKADYSGNTIVVNSGADVQIASDKTWTATTVAAGGELGGTGSVSGSLTLQANSTLDASAGALTVSGLTLPESGSVTVKVADDAEPGTMLLKKSSPTADEAKKFVVTDNAYVTTQTTGDTVGFVLGKVNTENLPAGSTALAGILDAAQDAAVSAGATSVELAYGTSGGVQLDAMTAEAGAALFTGITTTTTEASTTTVTVAYDFGITGITVSGNNIEVTAKVQGSGGASAGYASGTTVTLYKDGQNTGETGTIGNDGTVTFTLSDGLSGISDNTAAKFTVKAEKATP